MSGLELGDVLLLEAVRVESGVAAREVSGDTSVEVLGVVVLAVLDGSAYGVVLLLVLGDERVASVGLEFEVGLVELVVFRLPLVFSFVVLAVPYGEVDDGVLKVPAVLLEGE